MATYRFTPHTHLHCLALFETYATRLRKHFTLGHQTFLEQANDVAEGAFAIRHFASRVLVFHPDGLLTVAIGGYASVSTTERLNVFSPDGLRFVRQAGQRRLLPAQVNMWTADKVLHRFVEGGREAVRLRRISVFGGWAWEFDQ